MFVAAAAVAEPEQTPLPWVPADLSVPKPSLAELIEAPRVEREVVVQCDGIIAIDGQLLGLFCFDGDSVQSLPVLAVTHAAKLARASPALVSGKHAPVRLQFLVRFSPGAERTGVTVVPNSGFPLADGSLDYVAPQLFFDAFEPYGRSGLGTVVVVYRVSTEGRVVEAKTSDTARSSRCPIFERRNQSRALSAFVGQRSFES